MTQVKELGVMGVACPELAADLDKVFGAFQLVGEHNAVPAEWPAALQTAFNRTNPAEVPINGAAAQAYFTASPSKLCPDGRAVDLDTIAHLMASARATICLEVMVWFDKQQEGGGGGGGGGGEKKKKKENRGQGE